MPGSLGWRVNETSRNLNKTQKHNTELLHIGNMLHDSCEQPPWTDDISYNSPTHHYCFITLNYQYLPPWCLSAYTEAFLSRTDSAEHPALDPPSSPPFSHSMLQFNLVLPQSALLLPMATINLYSLTNNHSHPSTGLSDSSPGRPDTN